jgi:hypothetical protein
MTPDRNTSTVEHAEHRVAIVVDPSYAERIVGLARECHVWLVRSALNDPAVAALREDDSGFSFDSGVTTFNAAESPQASFLSILGTVEEHHGKYSHDPPVSVIEVLGLEPSAPIRDELRSYGFGHIKPSQNGFVARRETA